MSVLIYGSLLYLSAFVLHVLLWKVRLPRRHTRALLRLFLGVFGVGLLAMLVLGRRISIWGIPPPAALPEYLQMALFLVSLTMAYVGVYTAIEADSPSLVIIMRIAKAGTSGVSREALDRTLDDDVLIKPRLRDLLADRLVEFDGEKYRLKRSGLIMARVFAFYRNVVMRRQDKGG